MRQGRKILVLAVGLAAFTAGCGDDDDDGDSQVPNPAAVYCESQGGIVSGEEPMCELPDGSVVDAWELYRDNNPGE